MYLSSGVSRKREPDPLEAMDKRALVGGNPLEDEKEIRNKRENDREYLNTPKSIINAPVG